MFSFFILQENNEQFREKVIKKMENFFSSITITVIELDADVINCLKENKEEWLESFFNPEDWVDLRCYFRIFFNICLIAGTQGQFLSKRVIKKNNDLGPRQLWYQNTFTFKRYRRQEA